MRQWASEDEITILIAEDKPELKNAFKEVHRICQSKEKMIKTFGSEQVDNLKDAKSCL
jgi:hypothetical protein